MRNVPTVGLKTLAIALAIAGPLPALAQDDPAPAPSDTSSDAGDSAADEILVIADSLRGQVDAPEPPLLELGAEDIAAYGAGSLTELLDAISSQTGSGSGRGGGGPAILLNGARIASFREIASFPPEAIDRVEVLPEEVALRYGFSADQRVVNFVTKRSFSSREIELQYNQPWRGGTSSVGAEATYLQLAGNDRMNFNVEWNDTTPLTEADRGVIQTTTPLAIDPDPALYRTLVADSAGLEITGNYSTRIGASTLSVSPSFRRSDSLRLQGLDVITLVGPAPDPSTPAPSQLRTLNPADPLKVVTRSNTYSLGAAVNSSIGDWQLVGTVDANHVDSRSRVDRRLGAPGTSSLAEVQALQDAARAGTLALNAPLSEIGETAFDEAITRTDTANSKLTANGRPLLLPGGFLSVTLDGGYDWMQIRSRDTRNVAAGETSLIRGDLNAGVNVSVPITSTREDFLSEIGDLTLNLSGGIDHLSDFGTLTDWTAGLNWQPAETVSLSVTRVGREAAPSLSQLGNPEIATFNVPVFDLTRGETVLATTISGGNPNLPAQSQNDWRFRMQWQLPEFTSAIERANLSVEYFKNRSENIATGFPVLTPTIEAAFPGRVVRDPTGRLVSIDQRPVTLASQDVERIQVGLNINGPLGKALPEDQRPQNNNPMAQAFRAINPGAQGGQGGPGGQGGVQQIPQGQGGPGGFNPQVFQQLRERFCSAEAANTVPTAEDLAALPEQILSQLKNPDGTINPERWAQFRERACSAQPGGPGGGFNAQAFQRLRQQFCTDENADVLPTEEQLAGLPEQLVTRLKRPDGTIDPELWKVFRERICSANPPGGPGGQAQRGQGQGGQGQGGQGPDGPQGDPGQGGGGFAFQGGPGGPGGGGPRGGGGGFRGGGRGGASADGRGRYFFNLNYQRELSNEVLIAPGGPVLDLLNGDALSGGGQPRNSFTVTGGLFYRGFGSFYNIRYTGESRINGSGLPGSTDLLFDDFTTINFRVFADLNQRTSLIEAVPLLRDTRITVGVDNIFDERQTITDVNSGLVPLRYQPFLVDPIGRRFQVELRKLF